MVIEYRWCILVILRLPAAQPYDGWAETVVPSGAIDLGICNVTNGAVVLRAEGEGANPASTGARYYFGLDCVVIN